MSKHLAALILAVFVFVAVAGVVGPAAARGPMDLSWQSEQPPATRTISGVVERTDHGLSLFTSGGEEYILTGQDLSSAVGDQVTVKGKLSKNVGQKPEIAVKSFTPCTYC